MLSSFSPKETSSSANFATSPKPHGFWGVHKSKKSKENVLPKAWYFQDKDMHQIGMHFHDSVSSPIEFMLIDFTRKLANKIKTKKSDFGGAPVSTPETMSRIHPKPLPVANSKLFDSTILVKSCIGFRSTRSSFRSAAGWAKISSKIFPWDEERFPSIPLLVLLRAMEVAEWTDIISSVGEAESSPEAMRRYQVDPAAPAGPAPVLSLDPLPEVGVGPPNWLLDPERERSFCTIGPATEKEGRVGRPTAFQPRKRSQGDGTSGQLPKIV